jgi:hypothetical protein
MARLSCRACSIRIRATTTVKGRTETGERGLISAYAQKDDAVPGISVENSGPAAF